MNGIRYVVVGVGFGLIMGLGLELGTAWVAWGEETDAQAARDATIVEAALRLQGVDINRSETLKSAVLRHLTRIEGSPRYVELVDKLNVPGVEDRLLQMAVEQPDSTQGVAAADLLLKRNERARIQQVIDGDDPDLASQAASVLGRVGNAAALDLLQPLVTDRERSRELRTTAAAAVGRSRTGQQYLLEQVKAGRLPDDLEFIVANALFGSPDPAIRAAAAEHLTLPAAAEGTPLPPIAELAQRRGDVAHGQELFRGKAACAKCHKVGVDGKEVGPNLSEIGSKLSKEAMLLAILDPSAGISHNYETYSAILVSGNIVTGLLINQTDDQITIRDAEAIDKTFAIDEVEELIKSQVSLMPADLQKTMSADELVDVVEYLTTLKKPGA